MSNHFAFGSGRFSSLADPTEAEVLRRRGGPAAGGRVTDDRSSLSDPRGLEFRWNSPRVQTT